MEKFGYYAFITVVFLRYSRVIESFEHLHIPRILLLVTLFIAVMNGRMLRGAYHRLGGLILALTALYTLSAPFSVWPGGSAGFLTDQWYRSALMFFVTVAYITSFARLRTLVVTIGLAFGVVGFRALGSEGMRTRGADQTFGNSNDLAFVMLFGIPLCVYIFTEKRLSIWLRGLGLIGIPMMAYPMSHTGSRMMLVVAVLLMLYTVWKSRGAARVAIIAGCLAVGVVAVATMPRTALMRLGTFFSADAMMGYEDPLNDPLGEEVNEAALYSAVSSSYQRYHLLNQSLRLALENPLFGVGVGMFAVAENNLAVSEGDRRGSWQVAHNSYTEIACENGLIAFGVYLWILFAVWKGLTRFERIRPAEHPRWREWVKIGLIVKASWISYLTCSFFLSIGYQDFVPVIAAIVAGGDFVLKRDQLQLEREEKGVEEPSPLQPAYGEAYGYGADAVAYSANIKADGA